MTNKYFQLFASFILIMSCLAGFFAILILMIFARYSCRDLVRKSSTEPCINWRRLSRETAGRFINSTCPTATRMGFTTANRYMFFPLSIHTSSTTSLTKPTLSEPSAPKLPSLQLLEEQVAKTGILSSGSRWFVLLLLKVSCMLWADSNAGRSFFHSRNRCRQGLLQNILTLFAPRPNQAPCT